MTGRRVPSGAKHGLELTDLETNFEQKCRLQFLKDSRVSAVYYPDKNTSERMCRPMAFYHPLKNRDTSLHCPLEEHQEEKLIFRGRWASEKANRAPRLLYNFGRNVVLIAALYHCHKCKKDFLSIDSALFPQTSNVCRGFVTFHRSGYTQEAYDMVINLISSGMPFNAVVTMFKKSFMSYMSLNHHYQGQAYDGIVNPEEYPTDHSLRNLFMGHMRKREELIRQSFLKYSPREASIDHTFDIR